MTHNEATVQAPAGVKGREPIFLDTSSHRILLRQPARRVLAAWTPWSGEYLKKPNNLAVTLHDDLTIPPTFALLPSS